MSAAKGGDYERMFCKALTKWWAGRSDVKDVLFWRTAGSGGMATRRSWKGQSTTGACGDIRATGSEGEPLTDRITFELKRGYNKAPNVTLSDLLDKPDKAKVGTLEDWLHQARESARLARTPYWMLVHKRDARDPLVYIPDSLFDALYAQPTHNTMLVPLVRARLIVRGLSRVTLPFCVTTLDEWFRAVSPETIRRLPGRR